MLEATKTSLEINGCSKETLPVFLRDLFQGAVSIIFRKITGTKVVQLPEMHIRKTIGRGYQRKEVIEKWCLRLIFFQKKLTNKNSTDNSIETGEAGESRDQ